MNKKILIGILLVVVLFIAGIFLWNSVALSPTSKEEESQVRTLVENFGSKLKEVYISNPKEIASAKIKELYALFVTPELLLAWMSDPSKAPGRVTSSPWPEKIEIISIEKLDPNTIKVKGKIIYVTSGQGSFEKANEDLIVLIIWKDPETKEFRIDKAWYGEYAFYDGKELYKTLKEAFPDMNIIGDRGELYVAESIDITGDYISEAIVDMQTGGAYTEYYTVCRLVNGKLEVAQFKDENGNVSTMFFNEGASVQHEVRLYFRGDYKVICQYEIDRDEPGKITKFTTKAYQWNESDKMFEFSKVLSQKIGEEIKESLTENVATPKTVDLSSLKFKEIKSEFPAIDAVAVYNGKVAFSSGSGKVVPNLPEASNINHLSVYDVKSGKIEYSIEISKEWRLIDKIQMNDNWILYRVVENPVGAPAECFAINRKTKENKIVIPTAFEDKYVVVDEIVLSGNYAFVSMDVFEKKGTPEETFASGGCLGRKLVRVDLTNGEELTIFDGTKDDVSVVSLGKTNDYIVYMKWPSSSSKQHKARTLCLWSSNSVMELSPDIVQSMDSYVLTPDDYILYKFNGRIVLASLFNIEKFQYIGIDISDTNDAASSNDYIVSFNVPFNENRDISVLNRNRNEETIIKNTNANGISLNGSELCFVKHSQIEDEKDSVIYMDLKERS